MIGDHSRVQQPDSYHRDSRHQGRRLAPNGQWPPSTQEIQSGRMPMSQGARQEWSQGYQGAQAVSAPQLSSPRKRHVTFSSSEPQFHEAISRNDGDGQPPRHQSSHHGPPQSAFQRSYSYASGLQSDHRGGAPWHRQHSSSDHTLIQYDDDVATNAIGRPRHRGGSGPNMVGGGRRQPSPREIVQESDEEEHFIDGNYFFNYLVRNKAAEDYNMAEMLRERSRELQKTHWLFGHGRTAAGPHPSLGIDRLSTSLPADFAVDRPNNYFYYQDVDLRELRTGPQQHHRDERRPKDVPFAGGLEIEIPPRRHGGLGGGGLRQSVSADRLLMVPHTHRDSARFGRHYFRAGPSSSDPRSTNLSSYSATNLEALPLHVETYGSPRWPSDVHRASSTVKGEVPSRSHFDARYATSADTKEHGGSFQSARVRDNQFYGAYFDRRGTELVANTGRYNVRTAKFEPVVGSQPDPRSVSYSDIPRHSTVTSPQSARRSPVLQRHSPVIPHQSSFLPRNPVLSRYQRNENLSAIPSRQHPRDDSRNVMPAVHIHPPQLYTNRPANYPSRDATNQSVTRAGANGVRRAPQGVRYGMDSQTQRDLQPFKYPVQFGDSSKIGMPNASSANRTLMEPSRDPFERGLPRADPRLSVSWDSLRFHPPSNEYQSRHPARLQQQQQHWSLLYPHSFQSSVDVAETSHGRPRQKLLQSVSFPGVPPDSGVRARLVRSQNFDPSGRKVVTWQDQDEDRERSMRIRPDDDCSALDPHPEPESYVGDENLPLETSRLTSRDGGNSPINDSLMRSLPISDLQNVDQFALFEVSMSKLSWAESFMGTSLLDKLSQYKFVVLNRHEEVLFVGTELDESLSDSIISPHKSSFKVRILDANGQDVMHFKRLYPLKPRPNFVAGNKKKYRLEVATPSGHVIGNVEKTYDSDTYYILEDRTGECLFLVQKSCICTCPLFWDYEFKILLPEGETEVGEISWSYLTAQNEQFNGTEISFPIDLNTTSKIMLLGVCFLLNFSRWQSAYLDSVYNPRRRNKDKLRQIGPRFLRPQEENKEITALLQTSPFDNGFYRNEEDLDYHGDATRGGVNVSQA